MAKHRAPRYVRTKKALAGVPVAAGATVVGLGVLSSPASAATTHDWTGAAQSAVAVAPATPAVAPLPVVAPEPVATPLPPIAPAPTAAAEITNSAGAVQPRAQAAADAVVAAVPGAAGITIGGTRASAADPHGHPSGLALDYMVGTDAALGDAIVAHHLAHWDELGVEYVIWQQRILTSPTGVWKAMADRGSPTANHMDHPHVNYRA
ncbi:hypothetical protein [Geodermatophilus sabuli]|uniref:ARB-07466-like C-terminal domain-containing protein n=1 Tax=Geodermatophilus sabuli TaxID=1564158 RepID=A0A285EHH4_9ACTN|nr:hypothetical protein [Geodermatophilus sabuli]MBB3083921.1 hypothetical protein [Geodermatophilus sabuli]SNX98569.1 hypothetical protein SAMN06893097_11183 [Geodermatophilus sabuli]